MVWASLVEGALGQRVTRMNIEGAPHQLLLGEQRDLVLGVSSGWVAEHARGEDWGERIRE